MAVGQPSTLVSVHTLHPSNHSSIHTFAWPRMAARHDVSVALSGRSDSARGAVSGSPEGTKGRRGEGLSHPSIRPPESQPYVHTDERSIDTNVDGDPCLHPTLTHTRPRSPSARRSISAVVAPGVNALPI